MATSKNNRKKGSKRSASHAAPPDFVGNRQQYEQKQAEKLPFIDRHRTVIRWIGLLIMIVGFVAVYYGHQIIGFPITIFGAMIDILCIRREPGKHAISLGCYLAYTAIMIYAWFTFQP